MSAVGPVNEQATDPRASSDEHLDRAHGFDGPDAHDQLEQVPAITDAFFGLRARGDQEVPRTPVPQLAG